MDRTACGNQCCYDYVVVGSGLAALAFIHTTMRLTPNAKILCIERGEHDGTECYERTTKGQGTPLATPQSYQDVELTETPWRLTATTTSNQRLNKCAGTQFGLGGRSNYWYGWCMQPDEAQMRDFPQSMLWAGGDSRFWDKAHDLLCTRSISQLPEVHYPDLQKLLDFRISLAARKQIGIVDIRDAVFAQSSHNAAGFSRFSAAERLIELRSLYSSMDGDASLDIVFGHGVTRLGSSENNGNIDRVEAANGRTMLLDRDTKVILCAGPIANATLLLNSIPQSCENIGRRLGGHFRSHTFARISAEGFARGGILQHRSRWGAAAKVICCRDKQSGSQYHIQLSAFYCPQYEDRYDEIVTNLPRYGIAPSPDHLKDLKDDILISCATLGELDQDNENAWLRLGNGSDLLSNVDIQFSLTHRDECLWDIMDTTTFEVIENLAADSKYLQYWSEEGQNWVPWRPSASERRSTTRVHEACLTPVGSEERGGVLNDDFKVHGTENVYATGAGIFPTAGSWNPTLAVCAFSQQLACNLSSRYDHEQSL